MRTQRVRERRAVQVTPTATVEWGMAYEALLGLSMFAGDEPQDSYEGGKGWFRKAHRAASPALRAAVRRLVRADGPRWFLLLGMAHESGGSRDVPALLAHLQRVAPSEVLRALAGGRLPALRTAGGSALVGAALAGDAGAAAVVASRCHNDSTVLTQLLTLGAEQVRALTIEVIDRWHREVMTVLDEGADAILAADAEARIKSGARLSWQQLVESATGGIVYEGEAGIDNILLVPSLVTRPWITTAEWDTTKIFCYRADPSTAPGRGVAAPDTARIYRALGDETRLTILRELAQGEKRIADLVLTLGLAKSTIHGHLSVLRTAGLVRVNIGLEKRYALRLSMPDLNQLLAERLR